ncbi:hypothetical protein HMPREF0497_1861 [Lentilactobacillus buchneri ATCC 11577]|uniref:Uncharacterized protein n=1 Tax=Lentilactobacillus hilgardii (strain ATCC 8290 / DSM 20176 / CCUG 30140 / JCM 1155 / KCTC 3500 / NBRC 15886 / NCIMB 8040 / NRRL B-1843 / 9) TaxID=1423757 RepID=C0XHD0_LENH9|nr:hypothetical protein HMPREF0497_1861 [Lentilactobacillus buchneri ATCC 11577]EEI25202.1 hypothetical protein HMPREF0519_0570 [Lentilactobacillus hilgardii DSM 20176 = ATCC 8290]
MLLGIDHFKKGKWVGRILVELAKQLDSCKMLPIVFEGTSYKNDQI